MNIISVYLKLSSFAVVNPKNRENVSAYKYSITAIIKSHLPFDSLLVSAKATVKSTEGRQTILECSLFAAACFQLRRRHTNRTPKDDGLCAS